MENVSRETTKVLRDKCPLCGHNSSQFFINCKDNTVSHEIFPIHECDKCKLRYTKEVPSEETNGSYYKSDAYISHSDEQKGLINSIYGKVRNITLQQKLNWVNKFMNNKPICDLGAGTGYFVKTVSKKGNRKITGFEPDDDARSNALKNNQIELQTLDSFYQLDLIENLTMWHVLEHVYHLTDFLQFISDKMPKGATWIFAVPNCNSWDAKLYKENWAAYDVPRHLYHFRKPQIQWMADEYNFEWVETIPMQFDAFYVSMLSEKYIGGNTAKAILRGYQSEINASGKNNSSLVYVFRKK